MQSFSPWFRDLHQSLLDRFLLHISSRFWMFNYTKERREKNHKSRFKGEAEIVKFHRAVKVNLVLFFHEASHSVARVLSNSSAAVAAILAKFKDTNDHQSPGRCAHWQRKYFYLCPLLSAHFVFVEGAELRGRMSCSSYFRYLMPCALSFITIIIILDASQLSFLSLNEHPKKKYKKTSKTA